MKYAIKILEDALASCKSLIKYSRKDSEQAKLARVEAEDIERALRKLKEEQ